MIRDPGFRRGAPLAAALALALAPAALRAQAADTARADTVPLSPLVATASRLPVRAADAGVAVTVVGPDRLRAEPPLLAIDVLRALPGAHIDEAVGPGGPAIVRLRGGEEVFTQILMDGVQVNENGGFFDFQGVTLGNVERVEVARGPQSAIYGSSAVSGVVNFITRRGRPGRPTLDAAWEGGGAAERGGSHRGTASVSGGSARLRYSAGAGLTFNRGFERVPHDVQGRELSLRLDASPASRWEVTGIARLMNTRQKLPVRDPGATRVPLDPNARDERDRLVTSLETRYAPSARWTHRVRGSAYRQRFLYDDRRDGVASPPEFFVFDATFTFESLLWRTTAEYVGTFEARPGEASPFSLVYGASWEREDLENETAGDFGDGTQGWDRDAGALFAEARGRVGPARLMVGARAERYQDLPTEVTPRAAAVVDVAPGISLRAAAGRAYKVPNLQQQFLSNPFIEGNPDLEPERSTSWEIGADARAGRWSGGVAYFHQVFRDLIRSVPFDDSGKTINRNLGESLARGVEWSARFAVGPRWSLGTDGAWVDTEIRDNVGLSPEQFPEGGELPGRPRVVGSAFAESQLTPRVRATVRGTYVGSQVALSERFSGRRVELDPYFVASVNGSYALTRESELYLRVDNALGADYEVAFDRPGPPLTAALGVRITASPFGR